MSEATIFLPTPHETDVIGERLAATLPARAVVFLHGDLGAGKSTLARALLRGLGVTGPIKSPTYTLVERYALQDGEAAHLDLYRIAGAGELDFLGLDELTTARLWLVEWPERGAGNLPEADLDVFLAVDGQGRRLRLVPQSATGRAWVAHASKMAGSSGSA